MKVLLRGELRQASVSDDGKLVSFKLEQDDDDVRAFGFVDTLGGDLPGKGTRVEADAVVYLKTYPDGNRKMLCRIDAVRALDVPRAVKAS